MFEYFPGNYVWNLGVVATLNSGGLIDEVDRACRPIRDIAAQGSDVGTREFLEAWAAVASDLERAAERDEERGWREAAGRKYLRAAVYLCQAERMQEAGEERNVTYRHLLDLMTKAFERMDPDTTAVRIPYEGTTIPAYFTSAGPGAPCIVMVNGLDSTKEHIYTSGFPAELKARGISCLQVDQPGAGEALRLQGLTARIDSEAWAGACVDHLLERGDVDPDRIGIAGWSLGGYYVPRAAAFEKRFCLAVAWGANHDWGAVQRRRLEREGENPVPHYWKHVLWVWGHEDLDAFIEFADDINLDGVVERIDVPYLITHGEEDRQIPLRYAHRSYEQATTSPKRELRIFSRAEGGAEHIGLDNFPLVVDFTADWIEETFDEIGEGRYRRQVSA